MTSNFRMSAFGMHLWLAGMCMVVFDSHAATDDPAAHQVQILDESLLKSMRAGAKESITDRYQMLEPVIKAVFDLPLMTRLLVGPEWTSYQPPGAHRQPQHQNDRAARECRDQAGALRQRWLCNAKYMLHGNINKKNIGHEIGKSRSRRRKSATLVLGDRRGRGRRLNQ